MDEKLLLKPSKTKYFFLLFGGLIFAVAGALIGSLHGIFTFIFGLTVTLVSIITLLPNSSYLLLTPEGFTIRGMFRSNFTRWKDVKMFQSGVMQIGPLDFFSRITPKMIFFDYVDSYPRLENLRAFSQGIGGHEVALDTYGMQAEDLATLMNQWLQKYGK